MDSSWKHLAAFSLLCAFLLASALDNNDSHEVSIFEALAGFSLVCDNGLQSFVYFYFYTFRTMFLRILFHQHFPHYIVTKEMVCVFRLMKILRGHHKVR